MKKFMPKLSLLLIAFLLFGCTNNQEVSSQIEMRVQDGYIQYNNGSGWNNLISTEELKGEKGDKGDAGADGKDGTNGVNGKDGTNGTNGANGTNGINGKDGADGKNATVQDNITKSFSIGVAYSTSNPNPGVCYGELIVSSLDKAVIYSKLGFNDSNYNIQNVTLLMNENGTATVEAKAKDNWKFVKWSDGSTSSKRTISYNSVVGLTAYFECAKTPLTKPTVKSCIVDSETKNWIINWEGDLNANYYKVTLYDFVNKKSLYFSSKTSSLTINSNELTKDTAYEIKVMAYPSNSDEYMPNSYQSLPYTYNYLNPTSPDPEPAPSETTTPDVTNPPDTGDTESGDNQPIEDKTVSISIPDTNDAESIKNYLVSLGAVDSNITIVNQQGTSSSIVVTNDGGHTYSTGVTESITQSQIAKIKFTITVTTVNQELILTRTITTDYRLCITANKDVTWTVDGTTNYTIEGSSIYITMASGENIKVTAITSDNETKTMEIQVN